MLKDPNWTFAAFAAAVAKNNLALDRSKEARVMNLWDGDEFLGAYTKPEGREAAADLLEALLEGKPRKTRLVVAYLREKCGYERVSGHMGSRDAADHWWIGKAPSMSFIADKIAEKAEAAAEAAAGK